MREQTPARFPVDRDLQAGMLSVDQARGVIANKINPSTAVRLPLSQALGTLLQEHAVAPEDQPAWDRSAMDGYAIIRDDPAERFRVIGEVRAGVPNIESIGLGESVRIFTGGGVPQGATQVIMQEVATREGEWMIPTNRSGPTHIRRRGEDVRAGTRLLGPGTRLRAGELALLAQIGNVLPLVTPRPRVLHMTTGSELVAPEEQPGPGQIRDTNSTLVAALLADAGADLVTQLRCGDDQDRLAASIQATPAATWDLLLLSGGASVGDYDFGAKTLQNLGFEMHFSRINLRPGKPLVFATRGKQAAFVLPGNPVSHWVTFHSAVHLALQCLGGAPQAPIVIHARLEGPLAIRDDPRETRWPASLRWIEGRATVQPLPWQSSGDLCGLVGANSAIILPPGAPLPQPGEQVFCLDWRRGACF